MCMGSHGVMQHLLGTARYPPTPSLALSIPFHSHVCFGGAPRCCPIRFYPSEPEYQAYCHC